MTFVLGLTGSIGMGKSTTSAMFSEFGVPVYDADATVHALYRGEAASLIGKRFPGTVIDGVVDRKRLGAEVLGDAAALKDLEAIVHPLVRNAERIFITDHVRKGTKLVVLDIPLLFETHGEQRVDAICVVSAPADMQRQRVMDRQTMTEAQFEAVLAKQLPDAEKRARADCVIDTGQGLAYAKEQVKTVIERYQSRTGRIAHLLEKDLSDHA
jgi:dephospho-CoA kinase